jgi:hypothetical protein
MSLLQVRRNSAGAPDLLRSEMEMGRRPYGFLQRQGETERADSANSHPIAQSAAASGVLRQARAPLTPDMLMDIRKRFESMVKSRIEPMKSKWGYDALDLRSCRSLLVTWTGRVCTVRLQDHLDRHGFKLVRSRKHLICKHEQTRRIWTVPNTSSDHHSFANNLKDLERYLLRGRARGIFEIDNPNPGLAAPETKPAKPTIRERHRGITVERFERRHKPQAAMPAEAPPIKRAAPPEVFSAANQKEPRLENWRQNENWKNKETGSQL